MEFKVSKLIEILNAKLYSGNPEAIVSDFSIDTRTININDVYIGIKGESFDGNLFYETAFNKGASVAILDKSIEANLTKTDKTIILVENTRKALAILASWKIAQLGIPVIGITGSVGKTSTKDMIYSVVSKKYHAFKTDKNFNNDIGLPLSILSIKDEKIAVLEMGMNHLYEISYLSNIAKPDIAIITHILPVHIENLGTIENILKAKLEILEGLKEGGHFIFNNDSSHLRGVNKSHLKTISCGIEQIDSDLQVINVTNNSFTVKYKNEEIVFKHQNLTLPFIQNTLYAIAVGIILEISFEDIEDAISNYELTEGRLEHIGLNDNILLIDDAYNACSASMKNAVDYIVNQSGKRKIAIFGNMRELGDHAKDLHSEVGKYISEEKIDYLLTIGDDAKHIYTNANLTKKRHFEDKESLIASLKDFIEPEDTIIIKASNGEDFKKIIDFLKDNF